MTRSETESNLAGAHSQIIQFVPILYPEPRRSSPRPRPR